MKPLEVHGLIPRVPDERDILVGGAFTLPKLSELPEEYEVLSSYIYDQGQTDTCAGNASAKISGLQEGWKLDPLFTWMMARQEAGSKPDDWGIDLGNMAKAHVKFGALKLMDAPFKVTDDAKVWRDITNWDVATLLRKSIVHKKNSYVWVTPSDGMDLFDTLRATVWKFRAEKVAIMIGTHWPYAANNPDIIEYVEGGFGHAHVFAGWKKRGADIRCVDINSWGEIVGDKGKFYISRQIINKEVPIFGALFFNDETPENLRYYIENGIKADGNWLYNILSALYNALRMKRTGGNMLWDTPAHIRRNVRVMCDDAGLLWFQKRDICAIIRQESNWNPKAINRSNKNGTTDWGLLQINDHKGYHIGPGLYFASTDEVMTNIEKSVRFVIIQAKANNLGLWSSFKFGAYRQWLLQESLPSKPY